MNCVVFGTGGFAREVAGIVESHPAFAGAFLGFLDENPCCHGKEVNGHLVLGGLEWINEQNGPFAVFLGIGNPESRHSVVSRLKIVKHVTFPTLIHPSVIMGRNVQVGSGSIICAGTIITCNINIGSFVIINLDCTVGHDSSIDNFSTIAPGVHVSGNVSIGCGSDFGTGASVIQGISIGPSVIIGAGAVVNKAIQAGSTAVGVPAKVIKTREPFHFT